jgi:hypothetical protein
MQANCHIARHGYRVAPRPESSHASRNLGLYHVSLWSKFDDSGAAQVPDRTKYLCCKSNSWQTIHGRIHGQCNLVVVEVAMTSGRAFSKSVRKLSELLTEKSSGRVPDPRATDPGLEAGWPDGRAVMCTSNDLLTASMQFQKPNPFTNACY